MDLPPGLGAGAEEVTLPLEQFMEEVFPGAAAEVSQHGMAVWTQVQMQQFALVDELKAPVEDHKVMVHY